MYPGLRYAHKKLNLHAKEIFRKCLLSYKNRFAVEKKQKRFGQIQNYLESFCFAIKKNASDLISIYGNCMTSIVFKKRKPLIFFTRLFD